MKNLIKNLNKAGDSAVNSGKITLKLVLIFFLILALLIPKHMIKDLVKERERNQKQVELNIADQIGKYADVLGPVMVIPYNTYLESTRINEQTKLRITEVEKQVSYAYFTPELIDIESDVVVDNKSKDIYKMPFFQSKNTIKGTFTSTNFEKWKDIDPKDILFSDAFLILGISDFKGIGATPILSLNGEQINFEPGGNKISLLDSKVSAPLPLEFVKNGGDFSISLDVRGTSALSFGATAKINQLHMSSNWPHPNFESTMNTSSELTSENIISARANSLPLDYTISDSGFEASWNENQFSINQPSQWLDHENSPNLESRLMGAEFINKADNYDKTDRSVKYMALIIALVFMAFFIIELLRGSRVHPFQYILVGSAITIFYILLLALSEYLGFDKAYIIASLSTTILIGLYSISIFRKIGMAISISFLLIALFIFIYIILSAMQYSLLIGSIGLFIILAIVMFVTRNIQWYGASNQ